MTRHIKMNKSPLLTPSQRELLEELAVDPDADVDRRELSRLRARVRSIIADFVFLLNTLPPEERGKVFEDLEEYRAFLERKWDKPSVTIGADGVVDEPEGPLSGFTMRRPEQQDHVEEQGERLHDGVIATLGFLYAGVDDSLRFESMIEDAIRTERRLEGKIPVNVDVTIEMDREASRNELVKQWKNGNIELEEIGSLLESDPTALFEAAFSDDEE